MNTIIMQDPEIYRQIGELTGRFNTFERNMDKQFLELKRTIREQSVVPYPVFEKYVTNTQKDITSLKSRVNLVEDTLKIREATITGKLAHFLDSAIVKVIGGGVILGVVFIVYLNYQSQINTLEQQIKHIPREVIVEP